MLAFRAQMQAVGVAGGAADAAAALRCELARSRRYAHELTLVGVRLAGEGVDRRAEVAAEVRGRVRAVDSVWLSHDGFVVFLPESGPDSGSAVAVRIRREVALLRDATIHVAAFPADALTSEALLEVANGHARPGHAEPPPLALPRRRLAAARASTSTVSAP